MVEEVEGLGGGLYLEAGGLAEGAGGAEVDLLGGGEAQGIAADGGQVEGSAGAVEGLVAAG